MLCESCRRVRARFLATFGLTNPDSSAPTETFGVCTGCLPPTWAGAVITRLSA